MLDKGATCVLMRGFVSIRLKGDRIAKDLFLFHPSILTEIAIVRMSLLMELLFAATMF